MLTQDHTHLIDSIARRTSTYLIGARNYVSPESEGHQPTVLTEDALHTTPLWKDLTKIALYVDNGQVPLPEVREAIHHVYQNVVSLFSTLLFTERREQDSKFKEPKVFYDKDSISFVLALAQYPVPDQFQEVPLGKLLHEALYLMVNPDDLMAPAEVMKELDISRTRVHQMIQEPDLAIIYKATAKTTASSDQMRAYFVRKQIQTLKKQKRAG